MFDSGSGQASCGILHRCKIYIEKRGSQAPEAEASGGRVRFEGFLYSTRDSHAKLSADASGQQQPAPREEQGRTRQAGHYRSKDEETAQCNEPGRSLFHSESTAHNRLSPSPISARAPGRPSRAIAKSFIAWSSRGGAGSEIANPTGSPNIVGSPGGALQLLFSPFVDAHPFTFGGTRNSSMNCRIHA